MKNTDPKIQRALDLGLTEAEQKEWDQLKRDRWELHKHQVALTQKYKDARFEQKSDVQQVLSNNLKRLQKVEKRIRQMKVDYFMAEENYKIDQYLLKEKKRA